MLQKNKSKREEGFTIIEVLIVLAIAGLIILIVFLAVPALQRRTRNNQRTDDATRLTVAFQECLTNNRANATTCFSPTVMDDYADPADNLQLTKDILAAPAPAELDRMVIHTGMQCNSQGNGVETTALTNTVFAVTYLIETSTSTALRCIEVAR